MIQRNISTKQPPIFQIRENEYRLSTNEKKRILLNNIYGVDIDSQAVEVTKLSLLLKVLEGETDETLTSQFSMFRQRALPDLSSNIKCGNSLIGPDFYDQTELELDDEERYRINVFDWETEFKEIMSSGGFDAVIGNPPYYGRASGFTEDEKKYIQSIFFSSEGKYEIYQLFVERSLNLLKPLGLHSFITPQTWLTIVQARKLRKFIHNNYFFISILYSLKRIFSVSVDNIVYLLEKSISKHNTDIFFYSGDFNSDILKPTKVIMHKNLYRGNDFVIDVFVEKTANVIEAKINKQSVTLNSLCYVKDGIKIVGLAKKFAFSKSKTDNSFFPMLTGKDIVKYNLAWGGYYCCRDKSKIEKYKVTDIRLREEFVFNRQKIIIRKTGSSIVAAIDSQKLYYEQSLFSISFKETNTNYKLELILGILNSSLANYLLKINPFSNKATFPQIRIHWLKEFPIPSLNSEDKKNQKINNKIFVLVQIIQKITDELRKTKIPQEKTALQRQIDAREKQIDKLVYELYDLTENEIKIVEESFS